MSETFNTRSSSTLPPMLNELQKQPSLLHNEETCQKKFTSVALHSLPSGHVSPQERDAFRMKAIILLREYGIPFNCIAQALNAVERSPILTRLDHEEGTSTLSQTLSLLPGTAVSLTGSFKRIPEAVFPFVPIPNSFKLDICEWTQTGFPHPVQHTGWCLPESLLPADPLHSPLFSTLAEKTKRIAQSLSPAGCLVSKAMQLLALKKKVFEIHKNEWLTMHCRLQKALLRSANPHEDFTAASQLIEEFFHVVSNCPEGFDLLSIIHQNLGNLFITIPRNALEMASHHPENFEKESNSAARQAMAQEIIENSIQQVLESLQRQFSEKKSAMEKQMLAYISLVGKSLGLAAGSVLLQEFSAALLLPSLPIGSFARKIRTGALYHVLQFHEQLTLDLPASSEAALEMAAKNFTKLLNGDLALFEGDDDGEDPLRKQAKEIAQEIESYYLTYSPPWKSPE